MAQLNKKVFGLLLIIAVVMFCSGCVKNRSQTPTETTQPPSTKHTLGPGDYRFTIEHQGMERFYLMHVPKGYDSSIRNPLILAFHGGLGNGKIMSEHYNFIKESDNEGFIVVFPSGASRFKDKLATWNAGVCCGYAVKSGSDDVGFVKKILKDVENKFSIDENRIYATGMSNGGMFSYRLACEMSDDFAAIASVAGTKNTISCNPSRPVPVLHIHAVDDDHVLFEGGCGPGGTTGVDYSSVPETIEWWAEKNKCARDKVRVFENNGAYCDSYSDCAKDSEVRLCVTSEGGHSWPGGQKPRPEADTPSTAVNATEMIWEFFKKHPMKRLQRNVDDFRTLKKGMSYDEMVALVGESDRDIGSGIHIYLYELSDKSEIIVGGFVGSGLMYVKQKISNGTYADIIGFGPGDYDFSLDHDGLTRKYIVHVPHSYDNKTPTPAVIAFHGGGGNAERSVEYFRLNDKSDEEGFIVVYPEGTGKIVKGEVFGSWNAGRCCPPAADNNVDDVGFIRKMIEKLDEDFSIDEGRVYATGMSNGALMSYKLACELSDKIAAIAPSGGHDSFDECNPSRPVPVMHFHGTEDPCAFYEGGECGGCMSEFLSKMGLPVKTGKLWDCTSVPNYINQWKQINGCSDKTEITFQNRNATCVTYQECQDNAEVTLCTIEGMGHTWPGRTTYSAEACKTRPNGYMCRLWKEAVGTLSDDINANDAMWEFFKKHPEK
ncbi:MAG: PHB depolymerase family esterase [Candidatus Altiarchaeota archaeon]|nr:PHB depolymerase family esterase [Candidatus Altiarchaeota archaeon]